MATNIRNLWPGDAIQVDVLTPLAILRAQATMLQESTKGLLKAEVTKVSSEDGNIQLNLDVIAPALGNYRHRLLTATYNQDFAYPVDIEGGDVHKNITSVVYHGHTIYPRASTQFEFEMGVEAILSSRSVKAVLQSLIARSNEEASVAVKQ